MHTWKIDVTFITGKARCTLERMSSLSRFLYYESHLLIIIKTDKFLWSNVTVSLDIGLSFSLWGWPYTSICLAPMKLRLVHFLVFYRLFDNTCLRHKTYGLIYPPAAKRIVQINRILQYITNFVCGFLFINYLSFNLSVFVETDKICI